jgi:hypothetical protein
MSGGSVNCKLSHDSNIPIIIKFNSIVYHVTENGWDYHGNHDVGELHWEYQDENAKGMQ